MTALAVTVLSFTQKFNSNDLQQNAGRKLCMSILTAPKLKFSHGFKMYVIFARSGKIHVIVLMFIKILTPILTFLYGIGTE